MSGAQQYVLRRVFKIGKYRVDFLRREFWFKDLGYPYLIIETKQKDGAIKVKPYFRQRKSQ